MELPSVGMIKSFVAAGLGVSLISASFARDQVLAGRVKLIAPKEKELWRELAIAYRRDRTLTRATSTFIARSANWRRPRSRRAFYFATLAAFLGDLCG